MRRKYIYLVAATLGLLLLMTLTAMASTPYLVEVVGLMVWSG